MNEEQLGSMWRDLSATPSARILQVILEAVLQDPLNQALGKVDWKILVKDIRKRSGGGQLNLGRKKEGLMEGELNTDAQNGITLGFRLKCGTG